MQFVENGQLSSTRRDRKKERETKTPCWITVLKTFMLYKNFRYILWQITICWGDCYEKGAITQLDFELLDEITWIHLIAKEVRKHGWCFKKMTLWIYKN